MSLLSKFKNRRLSYAGVKEMEAEAIKLHGEDAVLAAYEKEGVPTGGIEGSVKVFGKKFIALDAMLSATSKPAPAKTAVAPVVAPAIKPAPVVTAPIAVKPSAPVAQAKMPYAQLEKLATATFGDISVRLSNAKTEADRYTSLEKLFWQEHLTVPGLRQDFTAKDRLPEPTGLRRVERATRQEKINRSIKQ